MEGEGESLLDILIADHKQNQETQAMRSRRSQFVLRHALWSHAKGPGLHL